LPGVHLGSVRSPSKPRCIEQTAVTAAEDVRQRESESTASKPRSPPAHHDVTAVHFDEI
jgi:hypothetical protein